MLPVGWGAKINLRLFVGLCFVASLFLGLFALAAKQREMRVETNSHVSASIDKVWVTPGRAQEQHANISFPQKIDGKDIKCFTNDVLIGNGSHIYQRAVMQIAIARNTCDNPDMVEDFRMKSKDLLVSSGMVLVLGIVLIFVFRRYYGSFLGF